MNVLYLAVLGPENDIVNQNIHSAALIRWQVGILLGSTIPFEPQVRSAGFEYLEKTISQFVANRSDVFITEL